LASGGWRAQCANIDKMRRCFERASGRSGERAIRIQSSAIRCHALLQSLQMDATAPIQYCSECGQPWHPDELARFGDRLICANCKNAYAQKLREGVPAAATFTYAGFWIRALAILIDSVILFVVGMVVQLPLARFLLSGRTDVMLMAMGLQYLIGMVIGATYEGVFISRFGATPGKMALDLKVVRPDGGPVSLGRAVGRYFAKILSGVILLIGYIMAGFDAQKRALHDMLCDTRVIKVGK